MRTALSRGTRWRVAVLGAALIAPTSLAGLGSGPAGAGPVKPDTRPLVFGDFYPPSPFEQVLKQPDGTGFKAKLSPGEVGGAFETLDGGYSVVRGSDQVWRYASGRRDGRLVATGAVVGKDRVPAGLQPRAGRSKNVWDDGTGRDIRERMFRTLQIASRQAQMKAAAAGEPRLFKFPVLMLATWWDAEAGQTAPQFQDGSDTAEYFDAILDGFGGNPTGTLTEFYFEDSFGQFLVQVDVFGPYTSQRSRQDRCYYGGIEAGDGETDLDLLDDQLGVGGGGALGMAVESVPQADIDVNFADYDNDGDGLVDFTGIIHSGADMAVTGNPCNTWSHAFQINLAGPLLEGVLGLEPGTLAHGLPTSDGVMVDRVFTMPEFDQPGSQLNIGVATHEMMHALGEPDYYNTAYTSAGTGDWDIMSGGSYLGNPPGSNPSGMSPASRVFQGWLQPKIVTTDQRNVKIAPRQVMPFDGYSVEQPDPNLILVPVKEIAVGEVDEDEHEWTETDVYGMPKNPATDKYVLEGYYIENMSRTVNAPSIHPEMKRGANFDRQLLSSGLMVWHWDYWLRSNVYYGSNNAQNDSNRPQMDPMEFDYNDNTQELQLNKGRGNPEDLLFSAAAGITSGTRKLQPDHPVLLGDPQAEITLTPGVATAAVPHDATFTVEDNPNNYLMTVTASGLGDCTLQLIKPDGQPMGNAVDSGFVGDPEIIRVFQPEPGDWIARIGDFAGCGLATGTVEFENSSVFQTKGAADTWSNWSQAPTGWAFTNVNTGLAENLDHGADAGAKDESITLDIIKIGATETDLAPGFVVGQSTTTHGTLGLTAGRANLLTVPIFNNGGKAVPSAQVTVRSGSADGPVVTTGSVANVAGYTRTPFNFSFTPAHEGPVDLYVQVDPGNGVTEKHEGNQVQKSTMWAAPPNGSVLVVDDDGLLDGEEAVYGALASLGVPYAIAVEHPDAATLKKYAAVIWEVGGDRMDGQLNAADVIALKSYLDGGGKLLISSPRIVGGLGTPPGRTNPQGSDAKIAFLAQYLGAAISRTSYVNNKDMKLQGLGGLYGAQNFEITQMPGRQVIDVMGIADPSAEGAAPAIGVTKGELKLVSDYREGEYLGIRVDGDAAHKNFKTITLGYNLAQHTAADEWVSIVKGALTHFGVPLNRYTVSSPVPIVYHPAVRNQVVEREIDVRAIVLGGPAVTPSLHYRRHGQGGYYKVAMKPGKAKGAFAGVIPPVAVTPDALDYYLEAGATFDPRAASTGLLAHGVGIARPEAVTPIAILPGGPVIKPPIKIPPRPAPLPSTGTPTAVAVGALLMLVTAAALRRRAVG